MSHNHFSNYKFCLDCARVDVVKLADWIIPLQKGHFEENPRKGFMDVCNDHLQDKTEFQVKFKTAINRNANSKYRSNS